MSSARSATKKKTPSKKSPVKKKPAKSVARKTAAPKTAARKATPRKQTVAKSSASSKSVASPNPTVEMCRELAALVKRHSLTELIVDTEEVTLTFRRGEVPPAVTPMAAAQMQPAVASAPPPAPAPVPAEIADEGLHEVTSPFVGTFYKAPNPDSPPYCEIGQRVEKGQVLCIVEAMKLMNEIEADIGGSLEAILVENGEPVEYGQALFKIRP